MPDYSTFSDEALLATCAWKEGRGEIKACGPAAILAIMHVIVNRANAWNQSVRHVILGPNQFTSMSVSTDAEFTLLPKPDDPTYLACIADAQAIMQGTDTDETRGALYYANLSYMDRDGWFVRHIVNDAARHPVTVRLGNHTFFE